MLYSNSITISLWVSDGKPPIKAELQGTTRDEQQCASRFAALGINNYGCLLITSATLTNKWIQLMLPPELHRDAFRLTHGPAMAVHFGMDANLARVLTHFWLPTMHRDVQQMVQTCPEDHQEAPESWNPCAITTGLPLTSVVHQFGWPTA